MEKTRYNIIGIHPESLELFQAFPKLLANFRDFPIEVVETDDLDDNGEFIVMKSDGSRASKQFFVIEKIED